MVRPGNETLRVAVVCGGIGAEREISLSSGRAMTVALAGGPLLLEVALCDLADPWSPLDERIASADIAVLALHGGHGEDGTFQRRLEKAGVPYLGSGPEASRLAMDKHASKECMRRADIPTPDSIRVERGEDVSPARIIDELGLPLFVKPVAEGSSIGVHKVRGEDELAAALITLLSRGHDVLVEQSVTGRELTVAVLDGVALPIIEIQYETEFFDYAAKYQDSRTRYFLDHGLSQAAAEEMQAVAVAAYHAHGARHLARVDFVHDGVTPWVLEINTLPGMTERSLVPKAAAAAGITFPALCAQLVQMVRRDSAGPVQGEELGVA